MLRRCPRCGYRVPQERNRWRCPHCETSLLQRGEVPGPWVVWALAIFCFILPIALMLAFSVFWRATVSGWASRQVSSSGAAQDGARVIAFILLLGVVILSVGVVFVLERAWRRKREKR